MNFYGCAHKSFSYVKIQNQINSWKSIGTSFRLHIFKTAGAFGTTRHNADKHHASPFLSTNKIAFTLSLYILHLIFCVPSCVFTNRKCYYNWFSLYIRSILSVLVVKNVERTITIVYSISDAYLTCISIWTLPFFYFWNKINVDF